MTHSHPPTTAHLINRHKYDKPLRIPPKPRNVTDKEYLAFIYHLFFHHDTIDTAKTIYSGELRLSFNDNGELIKIQRVLPGIEEGARKRYYTLAEDPDAPKQVRPNWKPGGGRKPGKKKKRRYVVKKKTDVHTV